MQQGTKRLPESQPGPKVPLVFVEWVDSCRTPGWKHPEDIPKTPKTCFTVGWILHEDRKVISLASSAGMNDSDGFDSVDGQMTIPKGTVIRKVVLSKTRL